uniref:Uncharacterized protein n=1 Tax=Fagus sylvatica TaxID=28930 RepID=A0A2N9EWN6_FAGSY
MRNTRIGVDCRGDNKRQHNFLQIIKFDQIKSAALDQIQIQQIKSLSLSDIIPSQLSLPSANSDSVSYSPSELRIFGVTDDLRDLVKGLTSSGSSGSQS